MIPKKYLLALHGLVLALLPVYLVRFKILGIPSTLLEVLLLAFCALVFLQYRNQLPKLKNLGVFNWAVFMFVLAGIISTLISPEQVRALGLLKAYIIEPVLFFYATLLLIKKQSDLKISLNLLALSSLVVSLAGIFQHITRVGLPLRFWGSGSEPLRIISVFEHPNALALFLAPLAVFIAALYFGRTGINRKFLAISAAVSLAALVLTFSRGAWLGVLIGLFALAMRQFGHKKALAGLAIILVLGFIAPQTRTRFAGFSDPSSIAHTDLMKAGVEKILDSPILGNGLFGFRTTLAQAGFSGEILNNPHNIFLHFWLELGLLGLIAFALVINLSFKAYQKNPRPLNLAAACFLVTLLVHGLVDAPYFKNDLAVMFWFMLSVFQIPD